MNPNQKFEGLTIRRALRQARELVRGESYLSGPIRIDLADGGYLLVRNRRADGGLLLGVFVADRYDHGGALATHYQL